MLEYAHPEVLVDTQWFVEAGYDLLELHKPYQRYLDWRLIFLAILLVSYVRQVMKGMNLHERQGFVTQVCFDRSSTVRNRLQQRGDTQSFTYTWQPSNGITLSRRSTFGTFNRVWAGRRFRQGREYSIVG